MKKLFTFLAAMMLGIVAYAQQVDETFQFVDENDNVVADGSVIVVTELNEMGQMVVPLKVKNMSGEKAAVSMYETIDAMPNGEWQTCAFGNCMILSETGYSSKNIMPAEYNGDIQTEWIPVKGQYATWEAKLQIHVFDIVKVNRFGVITETVGNEVIGYGPTVTVRFEYKGTKAWWGYVGADDECIGVGVSNTETYDCASFYPGNHEVVSGKTIHSVRFMLFSTNVKNLKVWIAESLPNDVNTDAVEVVNVERMKRGVNEVKLSKPYKVGAGGVYVGYSFTVTKLQGEADLYCVPVTGSDLSGALLLRTSTSVTEWEDLYGRDFGRLYLQVLLEGEFPYKNAVSFASANLGETVAAVGGTAILNVPLTNEGTENVQNVDYTVTTDGVEGVEQHLDLQSAISYGGTNTITLSIDADAAAGQKIKTLTITKVNGVANELAEQTTKFTLSTVSELVHRGIAVEEFTGTTCGWCPRGIVGMEKMRKEFGDNFVGIAIHRYTSSTSSDAMYIPSYNHVSFGGAPSCRINRGPVIDPYYGSGNDIFDDFRAELAIPAKVGVEVTGQWNEDSTMVEATATLTSVLPGAKFKIEYVLIADSLTGTTQAWRQYNYYNSSYGQVASASQLPADLAFLFNAGQVYNNQYVAYYPIFNDVAIAVANSTQTTAPGELTMGVPVTNTCTLSMPTSAALKSAITKERVAVVALVIDASTNTIANAAKFYMPGSSDANGIVTAHVDGLEQKHYSLDGRQLPQAKKGLNIIRMADGSIHKVVVR